MEKTTQDILNEAADLLQAEGRWGKGSFFAPKPNNTGCTMCAHGAIAYCGDRAIREMIESNNFGRAGDAINDILYCWINNIQAQNIRQAHTNAKQVGLTYAFNDGASTTKEEVIAKLRQAAQL